MTQRETRMRCLEAVCGMGVREPSRLMKDAMALEEWVMAGSDKADAPDRTSPTK